MRPVSRDQSPLRCPLNQLLATEAKVRLLRILSVEVAGPLTAIDLAERAGLSSMGARKALAGLVDSGAVETVGAGQKQQYALRRHDSLGESLVALFRAESARYEDLMHALRKAGRDLSPAPPSVWVFGLPSRPEEPLQVGILDDSLHVSAAVADARERFAPIEQDFDLTIEISGYTRADLPDIDAKDITLLAGVPPVDRAEGPAFDVPVLSGQAHDRLLVWSKALIPIIRGDPSLVQRARSHLDRLIKDDQGAANHDLNEWQKILGGYSQARLLQFLGSETARARRLAQSNPFLAVLNAQERARLRAGDGGKP